MPEIIYGSIYLTFWGVASSLYLMHLKSKTKQPHAEVHSLFAWSILRRPKFCLQRMPECFGKRSWHRCALSYSYSTSGSGKSLEWYFRAYSSFSQAADLDMTCSRWTNSFQNLFYFHAFTETGRIHMQLAEVRHCSSSSLRSRSEDHLWFCQSENWQGWDLGSHEEGPQTPLSGHSYHHKLGPRNQNSRKVIF